MDLRYSDEERAFADEGARDADRLSILTAIEVRTSGPSGSLLV